MQAIAAIRQSPLRKDSLWLRPARHPRVPLDPELPLNACQQHTAPPCWVRMRLASCRLSTASRPSASKTNTSILQCLVTSGLLPTAARPVSIGRFGRKACAASDELGRMRYADSARSAVQRRTSSAAAACTPREDSQRRPMAFREVIARLRCRRSGTRAVRLSAGAESRKEHSWPRADMTSRRSCR